MSALEFRVLGPVEVSNDGELVALNGSTTLTLLAGLLISPNRVVPVDTLIEWVWDGRLPAHPRAALHNGVSRLRRLVGEDLVETLAWGYRLHIDADRVDLLRFDRLLAAADQAAARGMAGNALAALDEAVGLWRAPLLGNIDSSALHREMVPLLTERYLGAVEERAGLCLRLGRPGPLAEELSEVVRAYPFRERIVGQLMVALVRSGRQADALAAYDTLRRALNEELGIDPLAALRDLQVKILRADPGLDLAAPAVRGTLDSFSLHALRRPAPPLRCAAGRPLGAIAGTHQHRGRQRSKYQKDQYQAERKRGGTRPDWGSPGVFQGGEDCSLRANRFS